MIEFIEHVQKADLDRLFTTALGYLQPKLLVITTPNIEFNKYFGKDDSEWFL